MDVFDEQLLDFWRKLNDNHVQYIMIGGLATSLHGFNRTTEDIDMWIEDSIENRKKLRKAFAELGYGDYESIETMEFVPGWTNFYVSNVELDIFTTMKGLENLGFGTCLSMASIADIDGIKIPFLHINHLIENKRMVNRPKDKIDVEELEKIKAIKNKKEA